MHAMCPRALATRCRRMWAIFVVPRAAALWQCPRVRIGLLLFLAACGGSSTDLPADGSVDGATTPQPNATREIVHTALAVDVTALTGTATITFGPSADPGATLEVGNEMVRAVRHAGADLAYRVTGTHLELALPPADGPLIVDIDYQFQHNEGFEGSSATGYTLVWPYFCGNLFPCHSSPADGTTFDVTLAGVPAGKTAVYPTTIASEAPSYQLAWAIDDYVETAVGTTTAGTQLAVWHRANEASAAMSGTTHLVAAFDWFEKTIGPYRFGPKAGAVSAKWGPGAFGGMEHHPYWHTGSAALGDIETNVHEAAHGWYGDGIRIRCWEDFVLSEGTVTYLAGRALDVVAPQVGATVWQNYENELATIPGAQKVWPQSCGAIDILEDDLFTRAPYIRGAFFYRALAERLGADRVDEVLATFYARHALGAATMADMLATIQEVTGYDPTACAEIWLRSTTTPSAGPCPQ